MEKLKNFFTTCINYLKANPVWLIIIGSALLFIIVLIVVIASLSAKAKKAKKRIAQQEAEAKAKEEAEAQAKADEEARLAKEEAERKATLEKLEAERLQAEKEEAERLAKIQEEEAKANAVEKPKATPKKQPSDAKIEAKLLAEDEKQANKKPTAKKVPAKKEPAPVKETEAEKQARYTGKWNIVRVVTDEPNAEEMFFFELRASNGEKLFSSEEYTSYAGAVRGIETHKTNIEKGNFKITLSKKGDYIFKLLSGKNLLLCMGENYPTKIRCESAIESTKRFAKTAVLDEKVQEIVVKAPVEDDEDIQPVQENSNGKWIIDSREGTDGEKVYFFELYANNGEKLLSSEEYTTYIGAVNGIQTHKANIEKDNFRISLTKRGDYIYKLLNGNGQLLCLGEHYKTKTRCQNAVESVKRFALSSPVLTDPEHTK